MSTEKPECGDLSAVQYIGRTPCRTCGGLIRFAGGSCATPRPRKDGPSSPCGDPHPEGVEDEPSPHGDNTPKSKDTNPKDAVAVAHIKFSSIPWRVMAGIAVALSEGAWKYRRHNYRVAGVRASVYFDATMDHLLAWFEGEDIDPDSGRHHIEKAITSLIVLRDAQLGGVVTDDRPPAVPDGWIAEGHKATAELFTRMQATHGDAKPPYVRTPESGK